MILLGDYIAAVINNLENQRDRVNQKTVIP